MSSLRGSVICWGLLAVPWALGKSPTRVDAEANVEKSLAPRPKICISARSATASRRGVSDATDLDDIPVRPLNNVQAGLGRPHY